VGEDKNYGERNRRIKKEINRISIGTSGTHLTCFLQGIDGVTTVGAAIPVFSDLL